MYSASDAIRLLKIELSRLKGEFTIVYRYVIPGTKHEVTGVIDGHAERLELIKFLEQTKAKRIDLELRLF